MASLTRVAQASVLGAVLVALGCEGQIFSPDALSGGGQGGGSANGGNGASATGGSGATATGLDGLPIAEPELIGPVVMRRLNRAEYDNTVRDLLGTDLRPAESFPADDLGSGFPTVGAALSLSPNYVLRYESAAHELIADLFESAERRAKIVPCDVMAEGEGCARQVLEAFARRAWRRPVTPEEVTSLLHPLNVAREVGASATEGLRHALAAVLLSPHFIFKVELSKGRLSPFELATRLSYALWGTMPDDALFAAAESGALGSDEGLLAELHRMLDDPRSDALLENFAARWLGYFALEKHDADARLFPTFSAALAQSMKREANLFIRELLRSDTAMPGMLLSRFTYVDERLSEHYGFSGTRPANAAPGELWRVDTSSSNERGGLLTLGALLTATSFSARTSPVKRGDFVFSHLLCGSIPPPPPGVEGLPEDDPGAPTSTTLRERMERHSQDPACSGCHTVMDPLGFGLENYDAIGRFRSHEGEHVIDASGVLPEGDTFEGAFELSAILAEDPRVPACITKYFMTYAIGRTLNVSGDDKQWVDYLTARATEIDGSLKSMIRAVVLSEPFRSRATE